MANADRPGGPSRWQEMREAAPTLAAQCQELDPDGIVVYLFSTRSKRYEKVVAREIEDIFRENQLFGLTDTADVP
ncbi:MAG: hypothetical protein HC890_12905 [Chloroflexaceae bacterium]|nr:hypothetical protein [Chloroflexaceae bacterium]